METLTYSQIEELFASKGYKFFKGHMNLNLFAIRRKVSTNLFDDLFYVVYEDNGTKVVRPFPCTTDAGVTYLKKPINKNGTAIIVPGQYLGAYEIGLHTGYQALRQCKPINYWRDNDRDTEHDLSGKIYSEIGYTNIHHAGKDSNKIDNWSAGCIVFKKLQDFHTMMDIIKESAKKYSNSFTFTLFEEL